MLQVLRRFLCIYSQEDIQIALPSQYSLICNREIHPENGINPFCYLLYMLVSINEKICTGRVG